MGPAQRRSLALSMLINVMGAIAGCGAIHRAIVVSADSQVLRLSAEYGFIGLEEKGDTLNGALQQASALGRELGAEATLILPSDLPFLTPGQVKNIIGCAAGPKSLVISSSSDGRGTNALLQAPPELIPFSFGIDSFQRHCRLAEALNIKPRIYKSMALEFDIDTADDLNRYLNCGLREKGLTPLQSGTCHKPPVGI